MIYQSKHNDRSRGENRLAMVSETEREMKTGRIVAGIEERWARRIDRAGMLRRLMLQRMKKRAIHRALERAF